MRIRHLGSLAIVGSYLMGWYLMIPPRMGNGAGSGFDAKAPLAEWFAFSSHDFAHECEGAKFLDREGRKQKPDDPLNKAFESAQCIATDDPRLKK